MQPFLGFFSVIGFATALAFLVIGIRQIALAIRYLLMYITRLSVGYPNQEAKILSLDGHGDIASNFLGKGALFLVLGLVVLYQVFAFWF